MALYQQVDPRGLERHYIQELESWEDFSAIVNRVLWSLPATIVRQGDGPDARYCILEIDGFQVVFVHNDMMGNCFFSQEEGATVAIMRVAGLFSD